MAAFGNYWVGVNGGSGGAKRRLIDRGTYVGFRAQAKSAGTAEMVKGFGAGRRTKASHAGTRGSQGGVYGDFDVRSMSVMVRWTVGTAAADADRPLPCTFARLREPRALVAVNLSAAKVAMHACRSVAGSAAPAA